MARAGGPTFQACLDSSDRPLALAGSRAVFLDRDGTLIVNKPYQANPDEIELLPDVPAGLRLLCEAGYRLIVVTNQSGVARGHYDSAAVEAMHDRLSWILADQGIVIDAYYFCPHHPDGRISQLATGCSCRKPAPGMLERGARDWSIDLTRSWMIGDADTDVAAGLAVGCQALRVHPETDELPGSVPTFVSFWEAAVHLVAEDRSVVEFFANFEGTGQDGGDLQ